MLSTYFISGAWSFFLFFFSPPLSSVLQQQQCNYISDDNKSTCTRPNASWRERWFCFCQLTSLSPKLMSFKRWRDERVFLKIAVIMWNRFLKSIQQTTALNKEIFYLRPTRWRHLLLKKATACPKIKFHIESGGALFSAFFIIFEKHSKLRLSQPVVLEINSSDMSRISAGSDRI